MQFRKSYNDKAEQAPAKQRRGIGGKADHARRGRSLQSEGGRSAQVNPVYSSDVDRLGKETTVAGTKGQLRYQERTRRRQALLLTRVSSLEVACARLFPSL